jgi:hypothetical protein
MNKVVSIDGITYEITDLGRYEPEKEMIFQIYEQQKYTYVVGFYGDLVGEPVRKIWKIVGIVQES